jgi:two-component system, chemotaxis family, chemotaxis protein CheY
MSLVLSIDDSEYIREQVGGILTSKGIDFLTATNGAEGIDVVRQNEGIKLILLDLNMPVLDGIGFLTQGKSILEERGISVVVLSAQGNLRIIEEARSLGAKGWIVKPISPQQLGAVVDKFFGAESI